MEPESPDSSGSAALGDGTSTQAEQLALLEKFVRLMASGVMTSLQDLPELRALIGQLCEKAPEAARTFATAILECYPGGIQQEPAEQEQETAANAGKAVKRKKKSKKDPPYRPPKTPTTQNPKTGEPPGDGGTRDNLVAETEDAPADKDIVDAAADRVVTESVETTEATSAPNMTRSQQTAVPQSVSETVPSALSSADVVPTTPTKQMKGVPSPPQTEEIHRAKAPTSLESISSSPGFVSDSSLPEAAPLIEMVIEAVRIIHQFSKYPHAAPRKVHSRILHTLRNDNQKAIVASNLNQWSDGSMWMQVLEMGSVQNQKATVFNMLEFMGA